jgi:hypothetical protein
MFSKTSLYSGSETPPPIGLRAGPLTMLFEPQTAFLRHLRLGDHEVVRAIYAAVRDHNWATVTPQVTLREQEIKADSFRLLFDCLCRQGGIEYFWTGTVIGGVDGRVQFTFAGEARSAFQRNRIGICVLHPIVECAGKPVTVEHPDGRAEEGHFPKDIAPDQPFFEISKISYDVVNTGIRAHLAMEGELFEMEDQRNWSDASFKTYCTPQARPQPQPVNVGDRVDQSVTLTLSGNVRPILPVNLGRPPQLSISTTPVVTLPPIGLCVASHRRPLAGREIERLKLLRLGHLRVDLPLNDPTYPKLLEQASAEAGALGVGLHVALDFTEPLGPALEGLLGHLQRCNPRVLLWILLHQSENPTSLRTVQLVRAELQKFAPTVLLAAGTRDFFTEINRDRPPADSPSFICYSNNPQVHAFDNTTMVENLAGQVHNVESARGFSAKPVVVSPITLRIRNNGQAVKEEPGRLSDLPSDVDPRQLSLFGAGWTLGSIARLATTGFVHSLTYYETTGWRGVMESEAGSPLPAQFPSEPGMVFPLYHVFADIAEFGGRQVYPTHSSHPLLAEGLTLFDGKGRRRVLVANFTRDLQELKIKTGTCTARVRYLDETNFEHAVRRPEEFRQQPGEATESVSGKIELKLLPYALARVDIG